MMEQDTKLKAQEACTRFHGKFLEAMLGYTPCENLTVGDIKTLANFARSMAFTAIDEVMS